PPKYLVSLANRHANGAELSSSVFNGGAETNDFLQSLGFTVNGLPAPGGGMLPARQLPKPPPQTVAMPPAAPQGQSGTSSPLSVPGSPAIAALAKPPHTGERCKDCKRVVKALLEKLYGPVQQNLKA